MDDFSSYTPPTYQQAAFHCPHCNVFSRHTWYSIPHPINLNSALPDFHFSYCQYCLERLGNPLETSVVMAYSIWHFGKLIYPDASGVPPPNSDLGSAIKTDYNEARSILEKSPRGAAALLRLCVQKLCIDLGEKGKNPNDDIGKLVKKGLPTEIQQALDTVRVVGNNAVHPGKIDLKDDKDTANNLFSLINRIADVMITQPNKTKELYQKIVPQKDKDAIDKRDQQPPKTPHSNN